MPQAKQMVGIMTVIYSHCNDGKYEEGLNAYARFGLLKVLALLLSEGQKQVEECRLDEAWEACLQGKEAMAHALLENNYPTEF